MKEAHIFSSVLPLSMMCAPILPRCLCNCRTRRCNMLPLLSYSMRAACMFTIHRSRLPQLRLHPFNSCTVPCTLPTACYSKIAWRHTIYYPCSHSNTTRMQTIARTYTSECYVQHMPQDAPTYIFLLSIHAASQVVAV